MVEAFDQYKPRFYEIFREDVDPLRYPLVKSLWISTDHVKGGLAKVRVFGVGCSSVAEFVLVDDLVVVPQPPPTVNVTDAGGGEKQSPF
ncbi:hypothetical protein LIER_39490 [Lithospermum erythrorhizon]|uniref:Uncharacterized protein n=1 Tax=Lithospermum erythrorhizon TaxID=34254 RepID=A0AAV3QFK1_LITER